jgi:hypothetical protein
MWAHGRTTHYGAVPKLISFQPGSSFAGRGFLDGHILEFAALEYLAAFQAFNEFRILFASHNLHARVAALLVHGTAHWLHGTALRLR